MQGDPVPAAVRAYLAAYNDRDVPAMLACLTPDIRFCNIAGGVVTAKTSGLEAFEDLAEAGVEAFSERRQSVINCIALGDRVALRVAYRAVLATDLPNGWKAGQTVALEGASFMQLSGDRIADITDVS